MMAMQWKMGNGCKVVELLVMQADLHAVKYIKHITYVLMHIIIEDDR